DRRQSTWCPPWARVCARSPWHDYSSSRTATSDIASSRLRAGPPPCTGTYRARLQRLMMAFEDAHALVIGISRYLYLTAGRDSHDAQDVAAVLQDATCCGYPPAAVRVLVEEAATRVAILGALEALAHDTRETSTVFIYYSGEGVLATGGSNDSYYLTP